MKNLRIAAFVAAAGLLAMQAGSLPVKAAQASPAASDSAGADSYKSHCAMCHGPERMGNLPMFPSLVGVGSRYTADQIIAIIHTGRKVMPPFPTIQGAELASLVKFLTAAPIAAAPAVPAPQAATPAPATSATHPPTLAELGGPIFQSNCAFCHGRDTMGGESGPDLTRSRLVRADMGGNQIGEVLRNGRPPKMPAFKFSEQEVAEIAAFIHTQSSIATAKGGARRGVDVSDLQTGNVEAGRAYFNGPGGCSKCHSATGDLAHIAAKFEGLQLEQQMLYPKNARLRGTVTLASGKQVTGLVAYQDEFSIGVKDGSGVYRSWPVSTVKVKIDDPVQAHVDLFPKYTDDDIHNLMAYIQTLR